MSDGPVCRECGRFTHNHTTFCSKDCGDVYIARLAKEIAKATPAKPEPADYVDDGLCTQPGCGGFHERSKAPPTEPAKGGEGVNEHAKWPKVLKENARLFVQTATSDNDRTIAGMVEDLLAEVDCLERERDEWVSRGMNADHARITEQERADRLAAEVAAHSTSLTNAERRNGELNAELAEVAKASQDQVDLYAAEAAANGRNAIELERKLTDALAREAGLRSALEPFAVCTAGVSVRPCDVCGGCRARKVMSEL